MNKSDSSFRIIVTGDSHIDGVVNADEAFPNVLETEIRKFPKAKEVEVINAGVGFYSFQNYLGVIKKYGYLKPDLFVVTVYTGNDFIEGLLYEKENQKAFPSLQTFWYRLAKGFFQFRTKMASTQSTNQLLFFKIFPEKKEKALAIAKEQILEIKRRCAESQTKLLVVLLPSKLESEKEFKEKISHLSGWSGSDININRELTIKLDVWLKTQKIDFIDPNAQFEKAEERLFWETDQHLNKRGHSLLAKTVLENYNWQNFNDEARNHPKRVKSNSEK